MKVKNLLPNIMNPRRISDTQQKRPDKSMKKFGDLGCIVFNKRTQRLVSGHQRRKLLPMDLDIVIERKYETPNSCKTIAEGYIEFNNEKIKYREVDADEKWESEAMVSANQNGGSWDNDLLKMELSKFPDFDYEAAGFDTPTENLSDLDKATQEFIDDKRNILEERDNKKETKKAFESVEENKGIINKRFVIIIDCPSLEIKEGLRSKLMQSIIEAGCRVF